MLYYINQFVKLWILPPGLNLFLAILGYYLLRRRKRLAKTLLFISFASLWILSMPMVSLRLANHLQQSYPPLSIAALSAEKDTAIVVLEAGLNSFSPEYGTPTVSAPTLKRLRYAAFLYQKTGIPILVSGSFPMTPDINQADHMAAALQNFFNTPTRWKEDKGETTAKEGLYATEMLKKDHIKKIFLVTTALHMPRAVQAFEGRGLTIVPAPTDYRFDDYNLGFISALLPTGKALSVSTDALHEYIGMLWYRCLHLS